MKAPALKDIEDDYRAKFAAAELWVGHLTALTPKERQERQGRLEMLRDEIGWSCKRIATHQARYEDVANRFANALPWFVIAVIHAMEGGLDFKTHLANGDPLTRRTVQVPAGLPRGGVPPFTWEEGARAALLHDGLDKVRRWDVAGTLYVLEGFNGWGYRAPRIGIPTPYLWSGTRFYTAGKYVADGAYSATAMSKQLGAALLLRELCNRGIAAFRAESIS